jgi:hypothetical protein
MRPHTVGIVPACKHPDSDIPAIIERQIENLVGDNTCFSAQSLPKNGFASGSECRRSVTEIFGTDLNIDNPPAKAHS